MSENGLDGRLSAALAELSEFDDPAKVAAHLLPWHAGSTPGDARASALARYLNWKLGPSSRVEVTREEAIAGPGVRLPLPPVVVAYQRLDSGGDVAVPTVPERAPHPPGATPSELGQRVAATRRRDLANGLLAVGVVLVISGAIVLLSPFVQFAGESGTISLFSANGICSSGLGQFAQAASAQASQACSGITLGFFVSWAAIVTGLAAIGVGTFRR